MTNYITPEALAERIRSLESRIKDRDEDAIRAAKIEAASLENRIRQDIAEKYAVKADLDKIRDKLEMYPSRVELIAAITLVSGFVSLAILIVSKMLGK